MNVCPECQQGKCRVCTGAAWDTERDELTTCTCRAPEHFPPGGGS